MMPEAARKPIPVRSVAPAVPTDAGVQRRPCRLPHGTNTEQEHDEAVALVDLDVLLDAEADCSA
jgi:hypothetical protein